MDLTQIHESFSWILQKIEFIGDIGTVQSYLEKWGKRVNFGNGVAEIARKSMRESKDKWCDGGGRKNWISVMRLPKFLLPKWVWSARSVSAMWSAQRETNCGNQVAKIVGKGGERKYELWQLSCWKWEGRKKKKRIVATKLPKSWGGI